LFGHGIEVFKRVFKVNWLLLSSSTLTRFWNKINTQVLSERFGESAPSFARTIIECDGIKADNINLDSLVAPCYGEQQGARKGYNPHKPGSLSDHTILAYWGSDNVVNVWNRSDDSHNGEGALAFLNRVALH